MPKRNASRLIGGEMEDVALTALSALQIAAKEDAITNKSARKLAHHANASADRTAVPQSVSPARVESATLLYGNYER